MATVKSARQPATIVKVVLLGVASGAVAWLPLVWLDPIPKPAQIAHATPADSAGKRQQPIQASASVEAVDFRNAFARSISPPDSSSSTQTIEPEGNIIHPVAPAAEAEPKAQLETDEPEMPHLLSPAAPVTSSDRLHPQPGAPGSPATHVRIGAEGMLPVEQAAVSVAELRNPASVAVASFESPIAGPAVGGSDQAGTIERMHDLNSADASVAAAAAEALAARGFSEGHLRLARKLTSANPRERASLAAELPGAAGIDARLWLTWLLRDDDADVRLAALGVLATTGDPDTLHRTIEIARQDPDPRIRQQIVQLEKMRRAR